MKLVIDKKQKKIFLTAGLALAVIFLFFVFAYLPKQAELNTLKLKLDSLKADIKNIEETFTADKKVLGERILKLRQESKILLDKFTEPNKTAGLLELLSGRARQCGVEILSMLPSEYSICQDSKGQAIKLDKSDCSKMSITMNMTGNYKALTEYAGILENNPAPRLFVKKIDIRKQQQKLAANMTVEVFAIMP